jgi:glycerophosphoryl diester phosphodiesterase
MYRPDFSITGHRGAMAWAPENSIESFLLAESGGADELELDIRASSDGVPIVLHDETLERVAGNPSRLATLPAADLPLALLRTIRLNSGGPVLTLAELLDATSISLQVEIKDPAAIPAVVALLERRPADAARIRFTSFLPQALTQLRILSPQIPRGLIIPRFPNAADARRRLDQALALTAAGSLYCGLEGLAGAEVQRLQDAGVAVFAWPLRSPADLAQALRVGARGGTADDPRAARQWLVEAMAPAR